MTLTTQIGNLKINTVYEYLMYYFFIYYVAKNKQKQTKNFLFSPLIQMSNYYKPSSAKHDLQPQTPLPPTVSALARDHVAYGSQFIYRHRYVYD